MLVVAIFCGLTLRVPSRNGRHEMSIQEKQMLAHNFKEPVGARVRVQMQDKRIVTSVN